MDEQQNTLENLQRELCDEKVSLARQLEILASLDCVKLCLQKRPWLVAKLEGLELSDLLLIYKLIAIDQEHLFTQEGVDEGLLALIHDLHPVEKLYLQEGGIIEYQRQVKELLDTKKESAKNLSTSYFPSPSVSLEKEASEKRRASYFGILGTPQAAEVIVAGGAADRLSKDIPTALIEFLDYTLLERMVRDLDAREYVFWKLTKKRVKTPLLIMISPVKGSDQRIQAFLEEKSWLGRDEKQVHLLVQPLVPTFDESGNWYTTDPYKLLVRPQGHGPIFSLILDKYFDELKREGRTKLVIRQVNNPAPSTDATLAALLGYGLIHKKRFGYVSVPRETERSEGVLTLRCRDDKCAIVNVEYVEIETLKSLGQEEFQANTNLLFADLDAIQSVQSAVKKEGLMLNFKKLHGEKKLARIEQAMQSVSSAFTSKHAATSPTFQLSTLRSKALTAIRKVGRGWSDLNDTVEGALWQHLQNMSFMMEEFCDVEMPSLLLSEVAAKGVPFLVDFHPALGPFWEIIGAKIQSGVIAKGSELRLEIADLYLAHFELSGALLIHAENVTGAKDASGVLEPSDSTGRVILKDVVIQNAGSQLMSMNKVASGKIERLESLSIVLEGCSAFIAEGALFEGDYSYIVPDGMCLRVRQGEEGVLEEEYVPFQPANPLWDYALGEDFAIELTMR